MSQAPVPVEGGNRAIGKWWIMRRLSQLGILGLFLLGPLGGIWVVTGNLNSSLTLKTLPLTDPLYLLQMLAAGQMPYRTAWIGAAIVLAFYLLVGGRIFCGWVCPMNIVTDTAAWLRAKLRIKGGVRIPRKLRLWVLGGVLVLTAITGTLAWELVNPVSMLHRGLIFGMGWGWLIILAIFLFDIFGSQRAWCGHLCPVGAFYGLLGKASPVHVSAEKRAACNDCMDCFAVCPEPQVITPPLRGEAKGVGPLINDVDCSKCGRCIDVCGKDVFRFRITLANRPADAADASPNN
jgi:ferredoxin-type protein NapH